MTQGTHLISVNLKLQGVCVDVDVRQIPQWKPEKQNKIPAWLKQRDEEGECAAGVQIPHLSANFPVNTEGLGKRARGRTWT